jgi:hypothetical protein
MNPKDIRPAYQEQDNAGKDILQDNLEHTYAGFTPEDNFIYITVRFGTNTILTSVDSAGNIHTGYSADVTFTIYGNQSSELSIALASLLKIPYSIQVFEQNNLFITQYAQDIEEMHEIINEQWFERHEFDIKLVIPTVIKSPFYPNSVNTKSVSNSIKVIAHENNKLIEDKIINVEK